MTLTPEQYKKFKDKLSTMPMIIKVKDEVNNRFVDFDVRNNQGFFTAIEGLTYISFVWVFSTPLRAGNWPGDFFSSQFQSLSLH